jgi:hypothetical protein
MLGREGALLNTPCAAALELATLLCDLHPGDGVIVDVGRTSGGGSEPRRRPLTLILTFRA